MKSWSATEWRWYRNRLSAISCTMEDTIERKNILKRVKWINDNRL